MTLSEQVGEDEAIFFDLDEMASVHTIQLPGESMPRDVPVVVDDTQLQQNSQKSADGTYHGDLLFFVRKIEVPGLVEQAFIQFDGVPYQVVKTADEDGVLQVTLGTNMGGF